MPDATVQQAKLPQLPVDLVLHILGFLPAAAQAWSAWRVNKAAHAMFNSILRISASKPDLSIKALQEFYLQHATTSSKQHMLVAGRAKRGDLAGVRWLRSRRRK